MKELDRMIRILEKLTKKVKELEAKTEKLKGLIKVQDKISDVMMENVKALAQATIEQEEREQISPQTLSELKEVM